MSTTRKFIGVPVTGSSNGTRLQIEVETQGLVDFDHGRCSDPAENCAKSLDRYGSDLLGLRLGIDAKAALVRRHENLEWEDSCGVACQWHYGDGASPEALGDSVGAFVADHDCGATFDGPATPYWIKIDEANLPTDHQCTPLPATDSQTSRSPDASHSSQAAA